MGGRQDRIQSVPVELANRQGSSLSPTRGFMGPGCPDDLYVRSAPGISANGQRMPARKKATGAQERMFIL
jgi:hypothetical protein